MSEPLALREPGLGGGYQYQWEVAVWLILCVLDAKGNMSSTFPTIAAQLGWAGRLARVRLEGDGEDQHLEDITLYAESGQVIHVQVKEKKNASGRSPWRTSDDDVVDFLLRRVRAKDGASSRTLFISNGVFTDEFDALRTDEGAKEWRSSYLVPKLRRAFNKKNPAKKCAEDEEPPDTPTEAEVVDALKAVHFSTCHGPDRVGGGSLAPTGGIGEVSRGALARFGAADPADAHRRLFGEVMHLSIREGGVELSRHQLGERVLTASGMVAPGGSVLPPPLLKAALDEGRIGRRPGPSWQDYEHGRVYEGPEVTGLVRGLLDRRVLSITGPAGSGKTVLACGVAARIVQEHDACAVCWDYEHDGPVEPTGFLNLLYLTASVFGQRPLLLLENVHRASGSLSLLIHAWGASADPCYLVVTSRVPISDVPEISSVRSRQQDFTRVNDERSSWGGQLLRWLLTNEAGLTEAEADKEARRPAWRPLLHDGWLIRHGVDSYKDRGVVTFWAVQDGIAARMSSTFARDPATEDLLYLVVALGRVDVATERDAAASTLGWDRTQTARVARMLAEDGWISVYGDGSSYLPWHVTLAELYWTCFQVNRDRWARAVRRSLASRREP